MTWKIPISHHLSVLNKIFFIHYSTQIVNKYSNKILFSYFISERKTEGSIPLKSKKDRKEFDLFLC